MTTQLIALSMAAIAYSFISAGIVLQKKGISWIGWRERKDKKYFKNLFIWLSGFLLMNIYGVPSAIALRSLPPHVVSAFAGFGIIVLIFLSKYFLKDKIFRSDYFYSAIVMAGIILLNLTENTSGESDMSGGILTFLFFLVPVLMFIFVLIIDPGDRFRNISFAAVSGCSAGVMVISLKGLVHFFEYRLSEYPGSLYFYLYIFFALLSFISLQMSLKSGPVLITGQIQYSTTIIYPLAGSIIVFSGSTGLLQLMSIALIVTGIIKILKNR